MRLINPSTNQKEWAFIFREENPQKAEEIKQQVSKEIIPGTEQKDPKTGQPVPGSGQPKYNHILNMAEIKKGFDLTVATGSTVSISKYATFDQAAALYQMQAIDKQALLEAADYPNRNDIIKRMAAGAEQAQQAAQQMQQMELQIEQAKVKTAAQGDQIKAQTDMQTTKMDNESREKIKLLELALKPTGGK